MSLFYRFYCLLAILSTSFSHVLSMPVMDFLGDAIRSDYVAEAISAVHVLQREFYDDSKGLWAGYEEACNCNVTFWWNSANCITTLADLTWVDNSISSLTYPIFANTFAQAPSSDLVQTKMNTTVHCPGPLQGSCSQKPSVIVPTSFINDYYDDDAWWALAWIGVYDLNKDKSYLNVAVGIFNEMAFNGYNASCGGMYWNRQHSEQNAITNELFLSLAAHLANRVDNSEYYFGWALKQLDWFQNSGLMQPSGLIVDGLDNTTCVAQSTDPSFSYNQGVILGALVELDRFRPNETYINIANTIATAAIARLSDSNGVLTEFGFEGNPAMGFDLPTFKGVFVRNLQLLHRVTGSADYKNFLRNNADSIWSTDRSSINATLGNLWDDYSPQLLPQGHCAAIDAIVAAASVSR
jgi:predicted alpha-1,6-mannanase (GH76 family)